MKMDTPHPRVRSKIKADFWFSPEMVMEVGGAEITLSPIHTCASDRVKEKAGLAIRFPRFTGRWRDDKGPEGATTAAELISMYESQLKKLS
jgi:DNA ligase-1